MHFSTSAALAAIALFAGQSLAQCTYNVDHTIFQGEMSSCTSAAGPNSWNCGHNGAVIVRVSGHTWIMHAGSTDTTINVSCGNPYKLVTCTANSWGSFQLDCPDAVRVTNFDITM
ncbi:hypothetical protein E4U55_007124 [Claviceps digitariae]|nr:hypothetical protein E4U55_007124 [Claviceps digitariae]